MKIIIEVIPHDKQRYTTVGDWVWKDKNTLCIFVSSMKNWKYEMLIALHELVEVLLCKDRKIPQKKVDTFDINFEIARNHFPKALGNQEPGDMTNAPYYNEHQFATRLEKLFAEELGVDFKKYNSTVENL